MSNVKGFFFFCFLKDKGKHLGAGPVHPLVSAGWNVLPACFLCVRTDRPGLPKADEEAGFAKDSVMEIKTQKKTV